MALTARASNARRAVAAGTTLVLLTFLATAPASGCASKDRSGARGSSAGANAKAAAASAATGDRRGFQLATASGGDDCASRLHDISGLLLTYYALNRQMPPTLDDLAPLAEAPSEFSPTCPATGEPYVYVPDGLGAAGTDQRLIVYDPTPAHGGLRMVIVASPGEGDRPANTRVIPFSEERLRAYVGNAE